MEFQKFQNLLGTQAPLGSTDISLWHTKGVPSAKIITHYILIAHLS